MIKHKPWLPNQCEIYKSINFIYIADLFLYTLNRCGWYITGWIHMEFLKEIKERFNIICVYDDDNDDDKLGLWIEKANTFAKYCTFSVLFCFFSFIL